jgi:hypothetical protein
MIEKFADAGCTVRGEFLDLKQTSYYAFSSVPLLAKFARDAGGTAGRTSASGT